MICVSDIMVDSPGFTTGGASKANDGTPFRANLKYAWRGSNTDALEICVKLCLQGE